MKAEKIDRVQIEKKEEAFGFQDNLKRLKKKRNRQRRERHPREIH